MLGLLNGAQREADLLINCCRKEGVQYIKIDAVERRTATVLGGTGTVTKKEDGVLTVRIPLKLQYILLRMD